MKRASRTRKRRENGEVVAVGYARVSTLEQASHGVSLEDQQVRIRDYSRYRGLNLLGVVTDAAVSGGTALLRRPGGSDVCEMVEGRKVDAVVVTKLDRAFRNAGDCLSTLDRWRATGVDLHLVDFGGQNIDTSTAVGQMMLTMLAGFAEFERNLIAERTAAALARKKMRGERVGNLPYGFSVAADGVQVVPNETEQEAIRAIVAMRQTGMTYDAIVEKLNGQGVEARGDRWHRTTVYNLVQRHEDGQVRYFTGSDDWLSDPSSAAWA